MESSASPALGETQKKRPVSKRNRAGDRKEATWRVGPGQTEKRVESVKGSGAARELGETHGDNGEEPEVGFSPGQSRVTGDRNDQMGIPLPTRAPVSVTETRETDSHPDRGRQAVSACTWETVA